MQAARKQVLWDAEQDTSCCWRGGEAAERGSAARKGETKAVRCTGDAVVMAAVCPRSVRKGLRIKPRQRAGMGSHLRAARGSGTVQDGQHMGTPRTGNPRREAACR